MSVFASALDLAELNRNWRPAPEASYGLHYTAVDDTSLTAEFTVGASMLQPHGIMHGGVSCMIGEGLGSVAGNLTLREPGLIVVGQNLQALHLRPAKAGMVLEARVQPVHIGRRSQIWETEIREKASRKAVARITLTLAVVERPQ